MSCYDWEAGKCNRGDSCRFSHGGSGGGGGGRSRRGDDRGDYQRDYRSGNGYQQERSRDDRRSGRERSRSRGRGGRGGGGGIEVGKIERLSDKGFGFIGYNGKSIFFHSSGMATRGSFDDLREGDEVEFETAYDDRKGKDRAENVVMLS